MEDLMGAPEQIMFARVQTFRKASLVIRVSFSPLLDLAVW